MWLLFKIVCHSKFAPSRQNSSEIKCKQQSGFSTHFGVVCNRIVILLQSLAKNYLHKCQFAILRLHWQKMKKIQDFSSISRRPLSQWFYCSNKICWISLSVFSMPFFCSNSGLKVWLLLKIVHHLKFALFPLSFFHQNSRIKSKQHSVSHIWQNSTYFCKVLNRIGILLKTSAENY